MSFLSFKIPPQMNDIKLHINAMFAVSILSELKISVLFAPKNDTIIGEIFYCEFVKRTIIYKSIQMLQSLINVNYKEFLSIGFKICVKLI